MEPSTQSTRQKLRKIVSTQLGINFKFHLGNCSIQVFFSLFSSIYSSNSEYNAGMKMMGNMSLLEKLELISAFSKGQMKNKILRSLT